MNKGARKARAIPVPNEYLSELARRRWAKTTKAQRKAHADMMVRARVRKMRERAAAGAAA